MSEISSPASIAEDRSPPKIAVALDVDDVAAALELARLVAPSVEVAKVGLELFSIGGPSVVATLQEIGLEVFVDLKLHDIPTTVGRAARALGRLGASYATVHAAGGQEMVAAAVEGFAEGAGERGYAPPVLLGVTVLTSDPEAPSSLLEERVRVLREARAGGLVCAASDLGVLAPLALGLIKVVPGVRPAGTGLDDQARVATPEGAARAGADVLVIGRPITRAADPAGAARAIALGLRTTTAA